MKILIVASPERRSTYQEFFDSLKEYTEVTRAEEADLLLVMGGDGSLNYLINNHHCHGKSVLYVPCGTANDFSKSLRLSNFVFEKQTVHDLYFGGLISRVPILKCNDRKFLNVASFGVPAEVTKSEQTDNLKNYMGRLSYYLGAINRIFSDEQYNLSLNDGEEKFEGVKGFLISQGAFVGGGVKATTAFNGCFGNDFNFLTTTAKSVLEQFDSFMELNNAQIREQSLIISKFYPKLKVVVDRVIPVKLDGEDYEAQEFHLEKTEEYLNFITY